MPLKQQKYVYNQSHLSITGMGKFKKIRLVTCACNRVSGLDEAFIDDINNSYDTKLDVSIFRTRRRIIDLAYNNPWQLFFSGTVSPEQFDRNDLNSISKSFRVWLNNYNRLNNVSIKYLLIPERHKDGAWHFHGLLMGLPIEHLKRFEIGDKMGKYIAKKVKAGQVVYNWEKYSKKFGFCDLEPIANHQAVSHYISKYITKDLLSSVTELNANMYYCSIGLKRAEVIKKGFLSANKNPNFNHIDKIDKDIIYHDISDYATITEFTYTDERLKYLLSILL